MQIFCDTLKIVIISIKRGIVIPDRTAWGVNYSVQGYTYPSLAELCNYQDFERFKIEKKNVFPLIDENNTNYFDRKAEQQDNFMANFANYLMDKLNFDFLTICLVGIDRASHHYWKYMEPYGFNVNKEEIKKYRNIIKDYYIYCDGVIGDLLKRTDKNTIVIIVSDHGFKANQNKGASYFFTNLDSLLEISNLSKIQLDSKTIIIKEDPQDDLWVPKKNIQIKGDLSKEELDNIKDKVKQVLKGIRIEETNRAIFSSIEETKDGFVVELDIPNLRPDYHLITNNRYKISDFLREESISGEHVIYGVVIISGKHIHHGKLKDASVYDITPTVLYLMGFPIAEDMDGLVLARAIDGNFLKRHPVKYIKSYETNTEKKAESPIPSPLDKEIKDKMKSLGYIN